MIHKFTPRARILFLRREVAEELVRGNDFPELVDKLIVRPVKNLILEEQHFSLILLAQKDKVVADLH